ncbi:MAG TPA: transposase [Chloroflexi bacterium]|nr:transposase [Chloroflexota bacterium]
MDPNISFPQRRNLRFSEFDYSQPGAYFVTIVTQNRKYLFGKIIEGEMILNDIGMMVNKIVEEIPQQYQGVHVEAYVIMPNHVHILFNIADTVSDPPARLLNGPDDGQPQGVDPTKKRLSLPEIVHRIKSLTTHHYIIGVRDKGWTQFRNHLWQRSYYEHIIRNERDHQAIYDYILANPLNWDKDEENKGT